ncbi:MAG: enoyl-ACP reductase FabI [Acidimicrobiia bacterium]
MGLLAGKRIVITGVRNTDSLALAVARRALEEGAEIVLTSLGRAAESAAGVAATLDPIPDILEFDATDPGSAQRLATSLGERWDRVDAALHAIAFSPRSCVSGPMLDTPWSDVSTAVHTSAYSLKSLTEALFPLMRTHGGSIVALDFDSRVVWPGYNWMGVAKSALESITRYLARELGTHQIRLNLIAAGPITSTSAAAVEGFDTGQAHWSRRAPLGWNGADLTPTANACIALMSDLFTATTGEMIHVDGGVHFLGD